jgi:glycerol-3-phosphate acyltransferase PlsX
LKIILDAMGGDNAPDAIIRGAVDALASFKDFSVILVGKQDVLKEILSGIIHDPDRIEIINANEVIEMGESPAAAIRKKKDSSMVVGMTALSQGRGDIFISAGNTGALVAGGTLIVRRIEGVKRPALATQLPSRTGSVLLIDGGANVDCKPSYLAQFGVMGSVYMQKVMGISNPKVGLVNNGGEEEKGNLLTKEAYQLMKNTPVHFVGNAEGRDLLSGSFDVIVCDGFIGNIILKFLEGTAGVIMGTLKESIVKSAKSKLGALFMKGAFRDLKKKFDYSEYGGALLLGLRGGVMKAHGSSDAKAISSAVKMARRFILGDVVQNIKDQIEQTATDGDADESEEQSL